MPIPDQPKLRSMASGTVAIAFCVPVPVVDELIETTHGTPMEAVRWFVLGTDMSALSTLHANWSQVIDLTLVLVPASDSAALDAALDILEAESVKLEECIWIDGTHASVSFEGKLKLFTSSLGITAKQILLAFT